MPTSRLAAAVLASALASPAAVAPENYTLDPYHTCPGFSIDYVQFGAMSGRFNRSSGRFTLDRAATTGAVEVTIEASSIAAGAPRYWMTPPPRQTSPRYRTTD